VNEISGFGIRMTLRGNEICGWKRTIKNKKRGRRDATYQTKLL